MAMNPRLDEHEESSELAKMGRGEDKGEVLAVTGQLSGVPAADGLPVEPLSALSPDAATAGEDDASRTLEELLGFHVYGRSEARTSGEPRRPRPIPALLHAYRDLSRIRYDYPMCIGGPGPSAGARPLMDVIDGLLAEAAEEGDAGEQLKRDLYRLESHIRSLAEEEHEAKLSALWDRATKRLLDSSRASKEKKSRLERNLGSARAALDTDVAVVSCDGETAARLLKAAAVLHWEERFAAWREDLDSLIRRVEYILGADFSRSVEARSPEHLRESLAEQAEQFDERALSEILSAGPGGEPMPAERRERVENVLSVLRRVRPVFDAGAAAGVEDGKGPFRVGSFFSDCAGAAAEFETRMNVLVDFFKSVRIARLEIENGYREALHNEFFDRFDRTRLTEEELALCPPVVLKLTGEALADEEAGTLLELLNSPGPFKILLQLDDLSASGPGPADWTSRLGVMAIALNHAYVVQAPVARAAFLNEAFLEGLGYPGPALFSVYTGVVGTRAPLSPYHRSAAATESRSFPVFKFDPGRGATLAERIDVGANPQGDRDWPTESFRYEDANGDDASVDLAFTPADFLYGDERFERHFMTVPPERWHENMVPLGEYLGMNDEEAATRVPYIMTVDAAGTLGRAVVTREILAMVSRCASSWRYLQESGGINNSFAMGALERERERLTEEKRREVEAIEKNYVDQLDQDIGDLTKEIVQRIASQLMAGDGSGLGEFVTGTLSAPAAPPPAPAAEPAAAASGEAEPVVEEEAAEEAAPSFDDPYIDTPLCTTCDECTKLNGQMFAYDDNKQAFIKNATAGPYSDLVRAAELCPVHIIHPGKPKNANEPGQDEWIKRAAPFN